MGGVRSTGAGMLGMLGICEKPWFHMEISQWNLPLPFRFMDNLSHELHCHIGSHLLVRSSPACRRYMWRVLFVAITMLVAWVIHRLLVHHHFGLWSPHLCSLMYQRLFRQTIIFGNGSVRNSIDYTTISIAWIPKFDISDDPQNPFGKVGNGCEQVGKHLLNLL